jgi:hypothetical protein
MNIENKNILVVVRVIDDNMALYMFMGWCTQNSIWILLQQKRGKLSCEADWFN